MDVRKHLCPACGRFIKWALLLCFDCNARIDPAMLERTANGQVEYPVGIDGAALTINF